MNRNAYDEKIIRHHVNLDTMGERCYVTFSTSRAIHRTEDGTVNGTVPMNTRQQRSRFTIRPSFNGAKADRHAFAKHGYNATILHATDGGTINGDRVVIAPNGWRIRQSK